MVVVVFKSDAIKALTIAALGLPGMCPTAKAVSIGKINTDFQYGRYEESDDRISVDVFQATAVIPVSTVLEIQTNWVLDTFSGATPVLTMPQDSAQILTGASGISGVDSGHVVTENDQSVQVMTGASMRETRYGVDLGLRYQLDDLDFHASASRSEEPDYLSHSYQVGFDWGFNQKFNTLSLGFGQSYSEIEPTTRPLSEDKIDHHFEIGFSQIVSKKSLLRLSANYSHSSGYLSNPYKKVFVQGGESDIELQSGGFSHVFYENRPEQRDQWSVSIGYIQYFSLLDSAFHLDYRFYQDSWSIASHTFEAVYHQPIAKHWMLIPRIRYYTQSKADFYQAFYQTTRNDSHYSSDFRLAGFGSLGGGLKLSREWKSLNKYAESITLEFGFEYSVHAADLQLGGEKFSNITDFDYGLFTSAVKVKF